MSITVDAIKKELQAHADENLRRSAQRFFKEPIICYGVKTSIVGNIALKYWKEVKLLPKKELFSLCEGLYRSGVCEEAYVVSFWGVRFADRLEPSDIPMIRRWIETYITNWATCDGFCNHTVGGFIERYPEYVWELKRWAKSKNRWLKRASAVSLIVPAKKGKFLKDVFEITDILLNDPDDMVQKGYGWMLKVASQAHEKEVFDYVFSHKKNMPRTALRYAIEKMPQRLKIQAMRKNS